VSEVTIVMRGHGRGEVFIDGEKVKGVKGVEFAGKVNHANLVRLDIQPSKVIIDGVACLDTTGIEHAERHYTRAPIESREFRLSYG